ncbi:MAG: carbohydrate ABC transporter permease [Peptostreptococcaceae bacterium]
MNKVMNMNKRKRMFYLMIVPGVLLFFIFHTLPFLTGIFYSFTDWKGYGNWDFVGFKNYLNVIRDTRVHSSYLFTFKFAIVTTIIVNVVSLVLAMGLNAKIKFRKTLRALYFIPNILGVLIVGFIFNFIFAQIIPQIGQSIGSEVLSKNILGNENLAWLGIVAVSAWQAIAFNTIIYLSGLQTIPQDVYEASSIDGCTKWQEFKKITFPLIAPFFTINMVLSMKNSLMIFDQIIAMTGGGPGRVTESISVLIYKGGFEGGQFAYQLSNAVIYFIVILAISIFQLKFLEKREVEM